MDNSSHQIPKSPATHLHVVNLVVALIAGLISIVGGVYSLKTNVFSSNEGSLQGVVLDEQIAKPLWHAAVEVSEPYGSLVGTADTNENGEYSFKVLKKGNYMVKISTPFHVAQSKTVKIERNRVSVINFDLMPLPHEQLDLSPQVNHAPPNPAQYVPPRSGPNQLGGNLENRSPTSFPRRRSRYRSKIPDQGISDQGISNSNQIQSPSQNLQNAGNSAAGPSSFGQVLTQTGIQLAEEWLSKKSASQN